jgi:hypothetical protein
MATEAIVRTSSVAAGLESPVSAVTWSAVFAGALIAVAVSLALLVFGSALGLATISPWSDPGGTAVALGVGAAIWLIVMQWVASALGGYLAGRLRTKWAGVHSHEVFFRDTAHGLLTWALATILMAALFASTAASIIGAGTQAVATVASGAAQGATAAAGAALPEVLDPTAYYVDRLFRPEAATAPTAAASEPAPPEAAEPASTPAPAATPAEPATAPAAAPTSSAAAPAATAGATASATAGGDTADLRGEIGRLLARNLMAEEFDAGDRSYLIETVAREAGVDQATAEARIDEITAQAEAAATQAAEAADAAREAGSTASFFFFLSLLVGAFIACVAAAYGGRERDDNEATLIVS